MSQTYRIGTLNFTGSQAILSSSLDVSGSGRFTDTLTLSNPSTALSAFDGNLTLIQEGGSRYLTFINGGIRYNPPYAFYVGNGTVNGFNLSSNALTASLGNPSVYTLNLTYNDAYRYTISKGVGGADVPNYLDIRTDDYTSGLDYGPVPSPIIRIYSGNNTAVNPSGGFGDLILQHNGTSARGNVLIGTSTTSSFKLNVSGSGRFTNGLTVTGSVDVSGSGRFTDGLTSSGSIVLAPLTGVDQDSNRLIFRGIGDVAQEGQIYLDANGPAGGERLIIQSGVAGNGIISLGCGTFDLPPLIQTTSPAGFTIGVGTTTSGFLLINGSNQTSGYLFRVNNSYDSSSLAIHASSYNTVIGKIITPGDNGYTLQVLNTGASGSLFVSGSGRFTDGLTVTGSLSITSGSGDFYVHGHKQFNYGAFQNNYTLSGSANVSHSFHFNTLDEANGVSVTNDGSGNPTRITFANNGVYNLQFSAQIAQGSGTANIFIWFKKDGVNIPESATRLSIQGNSYLVAAWNFMKTFNSGSYAEIVWQSDSANTTFPYEAATGNIPTIPAIIATVHQVR